MIRTPYRLPKSDYGGTGKRLFIGLVTGTALLLSLFLLLLWLIPAIGLEAIHPSLPAIAGVLAGASILGVLWMAAGLVFQAYTGRVVPTTFRLRGVTTRFLLPMMELFGRAVGIPTEEVRRSFIKVNNELVLSSRVQCEPSQLLILLPHCIQSSRCAHRLTYHIDNCVRCGVCPLRDILSLRDKWGIRVAIATGGTIARRLVVEIRPKVILAVACERDLTSGIQDTYPLPVFGLINMRPHGPCLDTCVDVQRLEQALGWFIRQA